MVKGRVLETGVKTEAKQHETAFSMLDEQPLLVTIEIVNGRE